LATLRAAGRRVERALEHRGNAHHSREESTAGGAHSAR